jgi:ABC-type bacteriocin/lantibiotic exporter with double-glycine peptidase domain
MRAILRIVLRSLKLLSTEDLKSVKWLVLLQLLVSLFELVGIVSILPFMNIALKPEQIHSNKYYSFLYTYFHFDSQKQFLIAAAIVCLILIVFGNLLKAISSYQLIKFTNIQNFKLGRKLLHSHINREYEYFLNHHSSDLSKLVLSEVGQYVSGLLIPVFKLAAKSLSAFIILIMLVIVNPQVAIMMATILSVSYGMLFYFTRKKIEQLGLERSKANKQRFRAVSESANAFKEIKFLRSEKHYLEKFDMPSLALANASAHNTMLSEIPKHFLEAIAFGGMLLISIFLISNQGMANAISMLALYAFAAYKLMPSLQEIFASLANIKFTRAVLDNLEKELFQAAQEGMVELEEQNIIATKFTDKIVIKDLSFSYSNSSKQVINNINIEIPKKYFIGIIGETGAGKSTLLDIILGLLKPSSGTILVDGIAINHNNIRSWQNLIGYVPQTIYLSDSSIAENIAFGVSIDEIDMSRVEQAAQMAQISDFIENNLKLGYMTIIGERGARLSGGQRQRLGIARALYRMPEILVFDEATSALDNKTEQDLLDAIKGLVGQLTIIMVTHRLATIKDADLIYKIEDGNCFAVRS